MDNRCNGVTQKGLPCKRYAINNNKCKIHDDGPAKVYLFDKQCITLTFSNVVENSVGMEQIGDINKHAPFTIERLTEIYNNYNGEKELIRLTLDEKDRPANLIYEPAAILVLRNFYDDNSKNLFNKLVGLDWDTHALMKGEVKNKTARYNLCFADFEQEPDYINGKGRVIKINSIDQLINLQTQISDLTGYDDLNAEANYYFNIEKTGIGWHGDFERNIVIGIRFGDSMNLCFNWFHRFKPIGNKFTVTLNNTDLYIMSEKAVGQDWKKSSQLTLRHAAGSSKYTSL